MLTQLNGIDGIENSTALLADNGNRIVQIRIHEDAKAAMVIEKVRRTLRAEVKERTPMQLDGRAAETFEKTQDWMTISQLNTLAAMEGSSSPRFDWGCLLLALALLVAFGVFLFWLLRRKRTVRQRSKVQLGSSTNLRLH